MASACIFVKSFLTISKGISSPPGINIFNYTMMNKDKP